MAIADPTAIPESQQAADEYLAAADDYWSNHRHDEALTLYWAVMQTPYSDALPDGRESEIMLRIGTTAEEHGNLDLAWRVYRWGKAMGNEECTRRLAAVEAQVPDQQVDPAVVPATMEALSAYTSAAVEVEASDPERAAQLYRACLDSPVIAPNIRGYVALQLGLLYQRGGSHDAAYSMFEIAAATSDSDFRNAATAALRQYQHQDGTDIDGLITSGNPTDEDDAGRYLQGAIDAYDRGDTGRAEALATTVISSGVASSVQKGAAHYYLGALAYYAKNYDVARTHLTNARDNAGEPCRSWAQEMLAYSWQDH